MVTIFLSGCSTWKLAWKDEFRGPAGARPDAAKWSFDLGGGGWGNHELEYYTDETENAYLDGSGYLVISASPWATPAISRMDCWYGSCLYTSARLLTVDRYSFTYGRVEARIRVPYGKGIWPAFWMLGGNYRQVTWPACGEIDIMEIDGGNLSTLYGTIHGPGSSGAYSIPIKFTLPTGADFSDDYHIYAVEWEPDQIRWYVDANLYGSINKYELTQTEQWVFDQPFIILLNVAIGGDFPGSPDSSTHFPQKMYVDYVRVYQHP